LRRGLIDLPRYGGRKAGAGLPGRNPWSDSVCKEAFKSAILKVKAEDRDFRECAAGPL